MHILTVGFSLLLIGIQVNGFNFGVRTSGFLNDFKSIFQKNIAGAVVSAGLFTTFIPYPGQYSIALAADETQQLAVAKKKGMNSLDGETARIFQKAVRLFIMLSLLGYYDFVY